MREILSSLRFSLKVLERAGEHNTHQVIEISLQACKERNIFHMVAASTTGKSALELVKKMEEENLLKKVNLVIVTHNAGFKEPGILEFDRNIRKKLTEMGVSVLTCTMPTRSLNRAIKNKVGFSDVEIVAHSLRVFGEGVKVCLEISAMACDAGLIPPEDVIAIAGTSKGYDTAIIVKAESSNRFFDMKVREILCKPYYF